MSLPAGFKVNGSPVSEDALSPVAIRIVSFLNSLPTADLVTTRELTDKLKIGMGGSVLQCFGLTEHRERVGNKVFWGSRKSIALLREKLAESDKRGAM